MPHLAELRVHDNSIEADPATGKSPKPKLLLHMKAGRILNLHDLKKLAIAALKVYKARR